MSHDEEAGRHKPPSAVLGFLTGVQLTLATVAWTDLAMRPANEIRGTKKAWALIIAINFLGPIAYLTYGRRPLDPGARPAERV